ncbi:unnamed protein product [Prorocentrum cordatum]|uniref:Uncharacterized protein n=1 Tax=Prorocentrum cordatum TaxID=2364126 RepID=A0ABN9W1Y5_9DINO|nr:unnamed protein product [Polarella glacialis]
MVAVRPHRAQKIKPGRGHSCKEWDSCSLFHLYPTLPARPTNDDSRVPVGTPCHRVAGGGAFDLERAGSHEENEEDDKENEDDDDDDDDEDEEGEGGRRQLLCPPGPLGAAACSSADRRGDAIKPPGRWTSSSSSSETKRNERRKRKSRTLGHVPRPLSPVRSVQRRVKSETNSTV